MTKTWPIVFTEHHMSHIPLTITHSLAQPHVEEWKRPGRTTKCHGCLPPLHISGMVFENWIWQNRDLPLWGVHVGLLKKFNFQKIGGGYYGWSRPVYDGRINDNAIVLADKFSSISISGIVNFCLILLLLLHLISTINLENLWECVMQRQWSCPCFHRKHLC